MTVSLPCFGEMPPKQEVVKNVSKLSSGFAGEVS
jgi:hypothetical protein